MLFERGFKPDSAKVVVTSTEIVGSKDFNYCYVYTPSFFSSDYKAVIYPSRKAMSGFRESVFQRAITCTVNENGP
jgi:hypothetical protein